VPDMYISSYTPTLGALIRARDISVVQKGLPLPTMLLVSQPNTPGQDLLPAVELEIVSIKKLAPHANVIDGDYATCDRVLSSVAQHSWVHFACHGHQDIEPFKSHFSLHDGGLHMIDIVQRGLPHAELAVLSACHSAAGDETTPDEVLHLAAAMQFAGFRSVVGTMWAMVDEDGPAVMTEFYERLLDGKNGFADCTKAAAALNEAVDVLRKQSPAISASRWINFVHYGA